MKVLILGGASSGKSRFAQALAVRLGSGGKRFYLATMEPYDAEDRARIARHRAERAGDGFETLELPRNAGEAAKLLGERDALLCDSVTALLTNWMFPREGMLPGAEEAVLRELERLLEAPGHAVFVSDLLFADAACFDAGTESFRRALGRLNQRLAAGCGAVAEVVGGVPVWHKGNGQPDC